MVGAVQTLAEWEWALTMAVVSHVALWSNDPVLPAYVFEVDVEAASLTHIARCHREVDGASSLSGATLLGVERHGHQ